MLFQKRSAYCEASTNLLVRNCRWVLIRVDATPETGSGHVMRCIALAESFKTHGHDVVFVSRACSSELRQTIERRGFESQLLQIPSINKEPVSEGLVDAFATLAFITSQGIIPAWVVVDHYRLDATWEAAIRTCGSPLLVLDDLADRSHCCNVLLDQNMISSNHQRYPILAPGPVKFLLGGAYATMRAEFAKALVHREALLLENGLNDIVIFMGATDASNLTLTLAAYLFDYFGAENLVVIVGHMSTHKELIKIWCRKYHVRFYAALDDLADILKFCRLFVGACGLTAVEAQALGIPSLLIPLSPIQKEVAEYFAFNQRAVLLEISNCVDANAVVAALSQVLLLPMDCPSNRTISVFGAQHVVDTLMELT